MAHFVLVHGSGQAAVSWSRVSDRLRARGHAVALPELPKEPPPLGLAEAADRIACHVAPAGSIVVAHSLCGALLPLIAARKKCGLIVFVAAVVPEPGRSVRDQFTSDPSMFSPAWIAAGPRWFDPALREDLVREFLLHDADEATIAWGLATMALIDSGRIITEPCPLATWPDVPAAAIVAARDRTLSPAWCSQTARQRLGREPVVFDTGHCPHMSRPAEIAAHLEDLAAREARLDGHQ